MKKIESLLPPNTMKKKLVGYLKEAPKKCFFSVFNYMAKKESNLVALNRSRDIKVMVKLYDKMVVEEKKTFEEFEKEYVDGTIGQ